MDHTVLLGDCFDRLDELVTQGCQFDMIYLDPPFGSQKKHSLQTRDGHKKFEYQDIWRSQTEYGQFIHARVQKLYALLKDTGSLFFHCDTNASHLVRYILDDIFGPSAFVSEIVWSYRRWSNSQKGLLPSHQLIYFYAKTAAFKFNPILTNYSETTNADQILQRRVRDQRSKVVYARDANGAVVLNGPKRGVPLGDVWEIPYLNPKAVERVGYPTQKPILLLERMLALVTDPGDWILDPFCGSGTTLVAAKLNDRNAVGIDVLPEAVQLCQDRLADPKKTDSPLMHNGRSSYLPKDDAVHRHLAGFDYVPVARNHGIDGILKEAIADRPVFLRVQRDHETVHAAAHSLLKAAAGKGNPLLILIQTAHDVPTLFGLDAPPAGVHIILALQLAVMDLQQTPAPANLPARLQRVLFESDAILTDL
ncbi:MAG: site-specific DNA-methyltransferase [Chloroflexota bacterium]|nr:site-specific DNA-methyltransferase [Chloroflexota bacterium]